jgi:hypothetical protein
MEYKESVEGWLPMTVSRGLPKYKLDLVGV